MDIEGPLPHEEVAPSTRRAAEKNVDPLELAREFMKEHPELSPDEVVEHFARSGIEVPRIFVAAEKANRKGE